jgi:TonB family protein
MREKRVLLRQIVNIARHLIYGRQIIWAVGVSLAMHVFAGCWIGQGSSAAMIKAADRQAALHITSINKVNLTPSLKASTVTKQTDAKTLPTHRHDAGMMVKHPAKVVSALKPCITLNPPNKEVSLSSITKENTYEATNQRHTVDVNKIGQQNTFAIDSSVQTVAYQLYISEIRKKIARIGATFFPRDQYGKKLYGQLTISFTVMQQGQATQFYIVRSSGNIAIDRGMARIFQVAQPFAHFPTDMATQTHSLTITLNVAFSDKDRTLVI